MTITLTVHAPPVHDHGRVQIGHHAVTGEPVHYLARHGHRVRNGIITGDATAADQLVGRIVDQLRDQNWCARVIDPAAHDAPALAVDALVDAEHQMRRPGRAPLLLVWHDYPALARQMASSAFAARVRALAEHGPDYGVAQLVTTAGLRAADYGGDTRLRALLADNVIALHGDRADALHIGGLLLTTANLSPGHAYAVTGDPRRLTRVRLAQETGR